MIVHHQAINFIFFIPSNSKLFNFYWFPNTNRWQLQKRTLISKISIYVPLWCRIIHNKNTAHVRNSSTASSLSLSTKTCACIAYDGSVAFSRRRISRKSTVHLELKAHTHNSFLDTDSPDLRHSLPEPTSQQKKTEKNNVDEVSRFYTHSFLLFGGASQTS